MKKLFFTVVCAFPLMITHAQEVSKEEVMEKINTGRPFTLVFLKKGETKAADDSTMNSLQTQHLLHLFTMEREGKISIFGPVIKDDIYKGIIVFNSIEKEEVKTELNKDPYIHQGYLSYDMYEWFSIPGQRIP